MNWLIVAGLFLMMCAARAERINQEGRILGPQIVVTNAILFNTAQADAVVSSLQIFPLDNAWNEDISLRPVLSNSPAMISMVYNDLGGGRTNLRAFHEMNFVFVPTNQPLVSITLGTYASESDPGPYPIPTNQPIEQWPTDNGGRSLTNWQNYDNGSDRHAIIVQPDYANVWETWRTQLTNIGWKAECGALFHLNSNAQRKLGDTSADAGGLCMFPALVRYDECQRGMVEHAMRLIVKRTRHAYIYPASHYASTNTNPDLPAMGQRFRLNPNFNIPTNWTTEEKAVLKGLKKYGAIVADNGGFFSISVTPDDRYPAGCFDHLSTIVLTNFEVVTTTVATNGPRSTGAPIAYAGADLNGAVGVPLALPGYVSTFSNTPPVTNLWKLYSGPGSISFSDATRTNPVVTFTNTGTFTLMLNAFDNVHAVARDAVVVTVGPPPIVLKGNRSGANVLMSWSGGGPSYVVEQNTNLSTTNWTTVVTTNGTNVTLPLSGGAKFYRVR